MTSEPHLAHDNQILQDLIDAWASSVRNQDIEGVVAHHATDIVIYDVVAPIRSIGIYAYRRAWVEQFFPWAGQDGRFDLRAVAVTSGDRVAFATGLIECAGTEKGQRVEFTLRLTIGFEKREGLWTFVHEHHSEPAYD
ncbi:MAG: YybH family protein [Gammaproteobacteria bacterium]